MDIVLGIIGVAAFVGFIYWRVTKSSSTINTRTGTGGSNDDRRDVGGDTQEQ